MSSSDESVTTTTRTVCSFCGNPQFQYDRCTGCGGAAPEMHSVQPVVVDKTHNALLEKKLKTQNQIKVIGLLLISGLMAIVYLKFYPSKDQSERAGINTHKQYVLLEVPKPPKLVEPQVPFGSSMSQVQRPKSAAITVPDRCRFDSVGFSEEVVVYASRGVGKSLNYQINGQGGLARKVDVRVNQSEASVVLMLDAVAPTIWNIQRTVGTNIKAVFFNGNTHQVIAGMDDSLPIFANTRQNDYPCGRFKVKSDNTEVQDRVSMVLFGGAVEVVGTENNGLVRFGAPVNYKHKYISDGVSVDSYRDTSLPLPGQAGIDQALRDGTIRPASRTDMNRWIRAATRHGYPADKLHRIESMFQYRAYVVVAPFTYPVGLNGGNRVNFFIGEGVPLPQGDSGHSDVYDINTGSCFSTVCRMILSQR